MNLLTSLKYCVYGVIIGVPVAVTFYDTVGCVSEISGRSMRPTLNPDSSLACDKVWIKKYGFEWYRPQPGDVVTLIDYMNSLGRNRNSVQDQYGPDEVDFQ